MFAGITGAGKSSAGNFILNKTVFAKKRGFIHGTDKCSAATSTICGKTVKIIDTPGFFDAFTPTEQNFMEVSRALTFAKDGINAVAFVMDYNRYTEQSEKAIQQLLKFKDIQQFLFVLLTHAEDDGKTKAATDELIQQVVSDPHCPSGLKDLMHLVDNRVIMLESVVTTAESYQLQKREEFITMIDTIHKSNGSKAYTNVILHRAAQVYENNRLLQQTIKRNTTELLESNKEKIKQLNESTSNESSKEIVGLMDENEELEKVSKELAKSLTRITSELIASDLQNSNFVNYRHLLKFIGGLILWNFAIKFDTSGIGFHYLIRNPITTNVVHSFDLYTYNCRQQ